jgi:hypothetical protein
LAADADREEADSLAFAEDQDSFGTHPEAGEIENISVQSKRVRPLETWAARGQVAGYKVSVEVPVLRVVLDLDALGLDSDGAELAARTFAVMDHCQHGVVRPVDVGKGGVVESVQTDSAVETGMS